MRANTIGWRMFGFGLILAASGCLCSCAGRQLPSADIPGPPVTSSIDTTAVSPANVTQVSERQILLRDRTPLRLIISETISSKKAKVGDRVGLQVVGDLKIDNLVVIANKAPAWGTVSELKRAGLAWRAGRIDLRLDSVTLVNALQHPLQFHQTAEGEKNAWTDEDFRSLVQMTGGLGMLYLPFAYLRHGNQAIVPKGTIIGAEIRGDVVLDRASLEAFQPKPIEERAGPASVTVYYPEPGKNSVTLWCGVAKVAELKPGRRVTLEVTPGTYWFRIEKKSAGIPVHVDRDGNYYLRVDFVYSGLPSPVLADEGEAQAAFTVPTDPKDIQNMTRTPLADLQARPDANGQLPTKR